MKVVSLPSGALSPAGELLYASNVLTVSIMYFGLESFYGLVIESLWHYYILGICRDAELVFSAAGAHVRYLLPPM